MSLEGAERDRPVPGDPTDAAPGGGERGVASTGAGPGRGPDTPPNEADLARRFWPRIRLFAARRLSDSAAAEDVAQETLRRVVEALREDRVRNPSALPAFIFQTARNICLHRQRSVRRERRALTRYRPAAADSPRPDALAGLITDERRAVVRRALGRLSDDDRELLRLFFYEDVDAAEVARRLDISPGAARVRKHRALRRLSDALAAERRRNVSDAAGTDG